MELTDTQARIEGRRHAESLFSLLTDEMEGKSAHWRQAFIYTVFRLSRSLMTPAVSASEPMTDEEVKQFEKEEMPFGKHKGVPIGEVPLDYYDWLAGDEFTKNLNRYLANPDVQRRVEEKLIQKEIKQQKSYERRWKTQR